MALSRPNCTCYIFILGSLHIPMIYLLVSVWQWSVRNIGTGATPMFWSWHFHVGMSILSIFCHDILIGSDIPADTRRWSGVGLMLARRLRRRARICPTLVRRLMFTGIPVCMGHCMRYSVTLPQQIPANTGHWPNAATEMIHNFQRRPSICLALGHWLKFFWNDSSARFYTQQQYMRSR